MPIVTKRNSLDFLAIGFILIALVFQLLNLLNIYCYRLSWYDEGVYFNSGQSWAEGRQPYADFFCAHPPGVLALSRLVVDAGLGLISGRMLYWFGGALLTMLVVLFTRRLSQRNGDSQPWTTAGLAAVMLSSSVIFLDASSLVMTDLPASLLIFMSVFCLFYHSPAAIASSGILLALSTLFRVQGLVFAPGITLLIMLIYGIPRGIFRVCLFVFCVLIVVFVMHFGLYVNFDRYWDCVAKFHMLRSRTPWSVRFEKIGLLMQEPQFNLGMLSAAMMVGTKERFTRGLGLTVLIAALTMMTVGRSMELKDFILVMPFLCAGAASILASSFWVIADRRILLWAGLMICLIQSPSQLGRVVRCRNLNRWERPLIEKVASLPYQTIYTMDYKISYLAHKSQPFDYYSDDHCPLSLIAIEQYNTWLRSTIAHCECVVVTDALIRISPNVVGILLDSGIPLIFANPEVESEFKLREKSLENYGRHSDGPNEQDFHNDKPIGSKSGWSSPASG